MLDNVRFQFRFSHRAVALMCRKKDLLDRIVKQKGIIRKAHQMVCIDFRKLLLFSNFANKIFKKSHFQTSSNSATIALNHRFKFSPYLIEKRSNDRGNTIGCS